ncbi:cytoplasmic dynein 1 light intermediate chain 1 [Ostrinia furnacalis]|uniref:cytoplasmic dynein 1 light intermediate chain 1 n=1 Tax=Ostrinia furnacalis TaxID=93504 RepID=UPI00103B6A96|nr:cytoplasmic dynein 1 light intermediate chain 1 [Ostrinia furnacalis]
MTSTAGQRPPQGFSQHCKQRLNSKKQQVQKWLRYTEPGDELEPTASSPMKRSSRNLSDDFENGDDDDSPLPEAVLTTNLGLDIVVVVTKTDYMTTLEKEHDYRDEHFDFMQQWVRRFCLQYGAALFYTSAKEDKNCDLLYKYLTHRIYGLPFRTPALIVEKDAVLIPAGWDSMKKISILYENMQSCKPDDYYRDVIVQPAIRKSGASREAEVQAEDEQAFLQRQLAALQAGSPAPARADSPLRATHRAAAQLDGTKIGMGPGTPGNEGVLANFFNSLLYKKTGSPGGRPADSSPAAAAAAARSDAAAELDRLTRAKPRQPPPLDLNSSSEC